MSVCLLDVNVLIALMWPALESHSSVQRWFAKSSRSGWATCPFTQAAFVRIVSNPAFSRDAVTPDEALTLLSANVRHPSHEFWENDIPLIDAVEAFRPRIVGHRQITDAYLLGLAIRKKGRLVTLDRGLMSLLDSDNGHRSHLEVLST